ncbi:MAG: nucleotidyltransferase family protein [Lachnospiraceae bacterium]|nr:nucleotidyltransferase family protein [Lachnospiraceae bacterium]
MKTIGIIAEFNPFHNGHAHLLDAARRQFGADHIIVIMSGDHVQRGEPALLDKYARTRMALEAGADLVLELPVPFAAGSAQYFARGAVSALLHTGMVDSILFGSECGDITLLYAASAGHSAPQNAAAGQCAISMAEPPVPESQRHTGCTIPMAERHSPNDLLAIEYLKALDFFHSDISVETIPRAGAGYHAPLPAGGFASASALRAAFLKAPCFVFPGSSASRQMSDTVSVPKQQHAQPPTDPAQPSVSPEEISLYMPAASYRLTAEYTQTKRLLTFADYSDLIYYALLSHAQEGLTAYFDVYDDLSQKILAHLEHYADVLSFISMLKSKDIAYSHLSRALLHILLHIRTEHVQTLIDEYNYCPYLRLLGFCRNSSAALLHGVKANADRPILSKLADAKQLLKPSALAQLKRDIFASALYAKTASKKGGPTNEYRQKIIIL